MFLGQKITTKVLAEIAIFSAIAFALDYIQGAFSSGIFMNGGSIGIAMLPILIVSYRRGLIPGLLCGLVVSVVQLIGGSIFFINFLQFLLDYIVAYTVVGFAGAFAGLYRNSGSLGKQLLWLAVGSVVGGTLKFLSHFAAGYFWLCEGELWGISTNTMLYSFVYNIAYCGPNIVITTALVVIIGKLYPSFLLDKKEEAASELVEDKPVEVTK